jgi:pimeloyl-ACP methyl ester carboxylesterase
MTSTRPEIGRIVQTGSWHTNLLEAGQGSPVIFIHGSGPGVTAYANWRSILPALAPQFRVIAPDMYGFGFSERPANFVCDVSAWTIQLFDLMDALDIEKADLVGNSFGGALALAAASARPERVRRLVLSGSVGVSFPLPAGLDAVWGYEPSLVAMKGLLDLFAYDRHLVTDELAELRYRASIEPGFQESFSALFPKPRQRWVNALALDDAAISALEHETLIVHGREDKVIPLENSYRLMELIPNAQLHVFGRCGHWTQIERLKEFCGLLIQFLQ